ncbi:MAG: hypothetical protein JEY91_18485 [Spirochaetaceae bacterium]|nr:hypothetical protein [Spirochaetaceae bacterium]
MFSPASFGLHVRGCESRLSSFTFDKGWTVLAILFAIGGTLMAAFIIWIAFFLREIEVLCDKRPLDKMND